MYTQEVSSTVAIESHVMLSAVIFLIQMLA